MIVITGATGQRPYRSAMPPAGQPADRRTRACADRGASAGQAQGPAQEGREGAGQEACTRSGGVFPLIRKASRLSSALNPIALRVSTVAEPMCGSRNAFSRP